MENEFSGIMRQLIQDKLTPAQIAFINSGTISGLGAYVEKTANYTLTSSDFTVNCTSGTFTITLPSAIGITARAYEITNTGSGIITLDAFGSETIQGDLTQTIYQDETFLVRSTGANWIVV